MNEPVLRAPRRGEPQPSSSSPASQLLSSCEKSRSWPLRELEAGGPLPMVVFCVNYILMSSPSKNRAKMGRKPIVLTPGGGRRYAMGRISALFKADETETNHDYSVSEWWLDANTTGPGAHSHPEDDVFFVLAGTMSILVDDEWVEAPQGSFVLVPGGITHDFQNRSAQRAGLLNFSPAPFEHDMPGIVDWFREHPPTDAVAGRA
jgi:quercetin dioxygenase-like cupin family protein